MKPKTHLMIKEEKKYIKLLILEDSEDDSLLLLRLLKKNNFETDHIIVDNEKDYRMALEARDWDAIISDYSLRDFTGFDALEIYKTSGKDIPFIMVSGMIGEETAVKAMKMGAHDYLMKDRMERLAPAIDRELKEAQLRQKKIQAEQAYDESRKRFELLVNYSPIGILITTKLGLITYVNPKATEIFGYGVQDFDFVYTLTKKLSPTEEGVNFAMEKWTNFISNPQEDLHLPIQHIVTRDNEKKVIRLIATRIDDENIMVLTEDITRQHLSNLELAKNQKRLSQIINTVEDSIIELKPCEDSFDVLSVNNAFLRQTKLKESEVLAQNIDNLFPNTATWIENINKAIAQKMTFRWEEKLHFQHKKLIWEIHASPLFDAKGKAWRIIISTHDITERKKYEMGLQESELRSRRVAALVSDCIWEWNIKKNQFWWNEGIKSLFGYDESDIGHNIHWILSKVHPNDKDKVKEGIMSLIEGNRKNWNVDFQFLCKDGTFKHVNTKAISFYEDANMPHKITGAMVDMTHRKKMEELRIQSLVEGADNERKIIASELHDDLAQNLMLANLHVQEFIYENKLDGEKHIILETKDLLAKILEDTRKMSHSLMPRTLEDFGIVHAIENMVENVKKGTKIAITTYFNFDDARFDPQFEINVYRIVQESVNNIVKHSGASEAFIQMLKSDTLLCICIEDDGKGFDMSEINPGRSIGLKNIENRVIYSNGKIDVETSPGRGTVILIDFPISA